MPTPYDQIAEDYAEFVSTAAADPAHILAVAAECLLREVGEVLGLRVLDLGCGEGHLARRLAAGGACAVGVDTSERLLELAAQRSPDETVEYVLDDGQRLAKFGPAEFDQVVSNFALMDIPDLSAVCAAVFRVLQPGGRFLFTLTHPCFQLPRVPGTDGTAEALVEDYFHEGFWSSAWKGGIRGRVGAHHRTLSTYVNSLVRAGFTVRSLVEPRTLTDRVPKVLLVECRKP